MRTLLLMLLPILASGQIYVDSYRFGGAQLLLDAYPSAAAAYSLRLLDKDYTGDCITVRRKSDNALDTFGFVNNYLDTTALKSFCGTGATDSCWVRIWWNQADSAGVYGVKPAQMSTSEGQPLIMASGNLIYINGSPSVRFNGDTLIAYNTSAYLNDFHNGTPNTIFSLHQNNSPNNVAVYFGTSNAASSNIGFAIYQASNLIYHEVDRGVSGQRAVLNSGSNSSTASIILSVNSEADVSPASNRSEIYINGGSAVKANGLTNAPSTANASLDLSIGSLLNGSFKEIILYKSDQSSNRTGIRDNINSFYSIY